LSAVYLFPKFDDHNWDETKQYTGMVSGVRKFHGLQFRPIDNFFIATEFVSMMEREGLQMTLITLLFLLGVLLWVIRPLPRALVTFAHLLAGLVLLSGAMWLFKIPLNTINIAAFPIILGTGIDSFIHFGLRFDETRNIERAIQDKLPSVLISNLTSIIGFGGLLFTPSAGLRSLGAVAILGLMLMTLLCAFVFPRCLTLETRRQAPAFKLKEEALES
jgi:predicted RND superfamily exporter protein